MDIRQLRYFIMIAEEKQISAAAKKLYMSQPPLSQQLKNMEKSLGETLFERSGKFLEKLFCQFGIYRQFFGFFLFRLC